LDRIIARKLCIKDEDKESKQGGKFMKKILFVVPFLGYSNGVASCLKSLVNELAVSYSDAKVCVYVLYQADQAFLKEINPNVTIRFKYHFYFPGFYKLTKPFSKIIARHDLVLRENWDVIVAYEKYLSTYLVAYSRTKKCNTRKVLVAHGWDFEGKRVLDHFSRIVTISNEISNKIKSMVSDPKVVVHIPNLYDFRDVILKSKKPVLTGNFFFSKGLFYFIAISSLSPRKRIDRLLRSFRVVFTKEQDCRLIVVGDGEEKEQLINLCNSLGLSNVVFFLGLQSNPYYFLAHSNVFVCSSDWEGLSTSSIEASILQIPIVTTDVSGAKEIVENPAVGIVVQKNDSDLAQGMLAIRTAIKSGMEYDFRKANEKWSLALNFSKYLTTFFGD
jgi:glycosyltransferase involved in cell wall biosynthesis